MVSGHTGFVYHCVSLIALLPKSYFNVFGKQEKTQNDLGNYAIMHYNDEWI